MCVYYLWLHFVIVCKKTRYMVWTFTLEVEEVVPPVDWLANSTLY